MGTITKLNNVLCANISKVDNVLKANAYKWDDNTFCPTPTPTPTTPVGTPTPTPTITLTNTPTNTPTLTATNTPTLTPTSTTVCSPGCCAAELWYGRDCSSACGKENFGLFFLSIPCETDPCTLANATEILLNASCTSKAEPGSYSDGVDCYDWDGSSSLTYNSSC